MFTEDQKMYFRKEQLKIARWRLKAQVVQIVLSTLGVIISLTTLIMVLHL